MRRKMRGLSARGRAAALAALVAASCLASASLAPARAAPKSEAPVSAGVLALMKARGMSPSAPILMRAYKKESEIEVWKRGADGRYALLKTFPICRWSGALGPKRREGDRQAVEGFYTVSARQMNPNSSYYLSFDVGYPNAYDRAHGGGGSAVMVHGTCSSAGCFAMTDRGVAEIYALARDALRGGQAAFQFQAFPFRMSAWNMARYRSDPNIAFWRQLKEGSDRFEATGEEPSVETAGGRYAFSPYADPQLEALAQARRAREDARVARLVALGISAVRTEYADGGQHPSFAAQMKLGADLGVVSRPEALAYAGLDEVLTPARGVCARKGGCPDIFLAGPAPARIAPAPAAASVPPSAQGRIILAATRPVPLGTPEPAATLPALLSYDLQLKTPPQTLIAGAMPILPDAWF